MGFSHRANIFENHCRYGHAKVASQVLMNFFLSFYKNSRMSNELMHGNIYEKPYCCNFHFQVIYHLNLKSLMTFLQRMASRRLHHRILNDIIGGWNHHICINTRDFIFLSIILQLIRNRRPTYRISSK